MSLTRLLRSTTLVAALLAAGLASAHEYTFGDLKIIHPTARATAGVDVPGAGYLGIQNSGKTADTLLGASSPAVKSVEIHQMSMKGDVMQMRELPKGIEIPAGGRVDLSPGGTHLMLLGLSKPLAAGDTLPLTLAFAKAGKVTVELHVEAAQAKAGADDDGMAGMHMGH
jgi:copper(I)-binding protein